MGLVGLFLVYKNRKVHINIYNKECLFPCFLYFIGHKSIDKRLFADYN